MFPNRQCRISQSLEGLANDASRSHCPTRNLREIIGVLLAVCSKSSDGAEKIKHQ
jgi:hypothetical protein